MLNVRSGDGDFTIVMGPHIIKAIYEKIAHGDGLEKITIEPTYIEAGSVYGLLIKIDFDDQHDGKWTDTFLATARGMVQL